MSSIAVHCPYCSTMQSIDEPDNYKPFYVNCPDCARRFIVEPVQDGIIVFKDGEAPCCSDPDCRELEMGTSGQD